VVCVVLWVVRGGGSSALWAVCGPDVVLILVLGWLAVGLRMRWVVVECSGRLPVMGSLIVVGGSCSGSASAGLARCGWRVGCG
jgi:hypothetical protein